MMPLPEAIIAIWAPFAALFTQPVWCHVRVLSKCCLWPTQGEPPVVIRWVLMVDPTDKELQPTPASLASPDQVFNVRKYNITSQQVGLRPAD